MFKNEIKFIYDFNLNEVKKLGNFITYDQLLSANLHPAILQYISADVDYLIFEDRQKILRNSIFDYSGEKIQQQFSIIGEEIKHTKRFSLDYMAKLILHASSFTVNFVVRPRWALTKFIFDDENHKNTTEIKQILNYLYYYGHLRRIIVSYINRKKILSINEKEFVDLLYRIDTLSVESNARNIVQSSVKAMADFFNIGENSNRSTIPLKAVELFLAEKKFDRHLAKLKSVYGEEDKRIGLIDCLKVLDEEMYSKVDEFEEEETISGIESDIESEIPIEAQEETTQEEVPQEVTTQEEMTQEDVRDIQPEEDEEQDITVVEKITEEILENVDEDSDLDDEIDAVFESQKKIKPNPEEDNFEQVEDPARISENLMFEFEKQEKIKEEEPTLFNFVTEEEASTPPLDSSDDTDADDVDNEIQNLFDELDTESTTSEKMVEEEFGDTAERVSSSTVNSFQETLNKETELIGEETEDKDEFEESFEQDNLNDETEIDVLNYESDQVNDDIDKTTEVPDVKSRLSELVSVVNEESEESLDEEKKSEDINISEEDVEIDSNEVVEKEIGETQETSKEEDNLSTGNFDISEILENKNLTKVIEVIFDYDIEDFALTIEKACKAENYQSGLEFLNGVFSTNHVDPQSKEAEALKSVVAEFFNNTK